MNFSAFLIMAFLCSHAFAADKTGVTGACDDISGRYSFLGNWNKFEFLGGDPRSNAQFKDRYVQPRFDLFALDYYFERINPAFVLLQLDRPAGTLFLEMYDLGTHGRIEFPVSQVAIRCSEGRWQIQSERSGGGENVPSTTFERRYLRKNSAGNLDVEGETRVVTGWIFKEEMKFHWTAEFIYQADR